MLQCPKCRRILMDKTSDGGVKLRSRMVIFQEGNAWALCPSCKERVEVPIILGAYAFADTPKHVIQNP